MCSPLSPTGAFAPAQAVVSPQVTNAAAPEARTAAPADAFVGGAAGGPDLQKLLGVVQGLMELLKSLGGLLGNQQALPPQQPAQAANWASGSASASASASAVAVAQAGGAASPASPPPAAASSGAASADQAAADAAAAAAAQAQAQASGGDGGGDGGGGGGDPLVFDLAGRGVGFDANRTVNVDLDGGKDVERITDLKQGTGLLTFDATPNDASTRVNKDQGLLSGTFGDRTDLSGYGVKGDRPDGTFSNGFTALRALGEKFGLITPQKQYLDGADLKVLEEKAGVKMRVGGVSGEDRSLGDLGISRIDLGDPSKTQTKAEASRDEHGNLLQRQEGASFTINGQTREYADAWFGLLGKSAKAA